MATVPAIGASRGIGLEFVRQHRAAGDAVLATARDAAGLARLREERLTPFGRGAVLNYDGQRFSGW